MVTDPPNGRGVPVARDDGWPVASANDTLIDHDALRKMADRLATSSDANVHAVVIARHGKSGRGQTPRTYTNLTAGAGPLSIWWRAPPRATRRCLAGAGFARSPAKSGWRSPSRHAMFATQVEKGRGVARQRRRRLGRRPLEEVQAYRMRAVRFDGAVAGPTPARTSIKRSGSAGALAPTRSRSQNRSDGPHGRIRR